MDNKPHQRTQNMNNKTLGGSMVGKDPRRHHPRQHPAEPPGRARRTDADGKHTAMGGCNRARTSKVMNMVHTTGLRRIGGLLRLVLEAAPATLPESREMVRGKDPRRHHPRQHPAELPGRARRTGADGKHTAMGGCNRARTSKCLEDEDEEFALESESTRRILTSRRYISYGALQRNSVPCSRRGASYYNCRPGAQANPYRRGCSTITRCRR
ncbi:Protein RALF-like 33 [Striga hermonthica]|uniref:Protein RALF-like 33 n=1 Tax=Striga hermonthica TaxID=68872 RepID=A0A9N7N8V6_STRHE|nr:Protein RALF-like 33 [Striga hermonthica]